MDKNYQINLLENQKYQIIIFMKSLSGLTFLQERLNIEKDLADMNIKEADVIVDNLPHQANTSQRFVEAVFKEGAFVKSSIQYVNIKKGDTIREIASKYYQENGHLLNDSLATTVQKRIIRKGYTL